MERLFDLDAQLLHDTILSALAILTLFTLMSYLLFNPARKLLKNRQDRIANDIADAQKDKQDAAETKAEYQEKLRNINKEAEQILSAARQKAIKNEARIVEEARQEAAHILARANEEALLEKKRVVDEVKQEMIVIASLMAGKVVAASIDTTIQDVLVEQTIKEIGDSTWLS
ncbi:F0F1 ATP synthase subunit B [Lachnospiraceae bacterium ZAX-1]